MVKIYDDINKAFGANLSASIFRRMIETSSRDHGQVTSLEVSKALQHSESTAERYYRVPDTSEAMRRQENINKVDHTALVKSYIETKLVTVDPFRRSQCILTVFLI